MHDDVSAVDEDATGLICELSFHTIRYKPTSRGNQTTIIKMIEVPDQAVTGQMKKIPKKQISATVPLSQHASRPRIQTVHSAPPKLPPSKVPLQGIYG